MSLWQDVRFGLRMMAKNPGFTLTAVVTLALGIGANTTVFTLVNAVLFRGLPFEDPDSIMYISSNNLPKNRTNIGLSWPDFRDWRSETKSLQGMAAYTGASIDLSDDISVPERYRGTRITSNLFGLIGVKPVIGRDFVADDEKPGSPAVALIGHHVWQNRYGMDSAVLGRTVRINEAPTTIIGVMPRSMKFPQNADIWLPNQVTANQEKRDVRGFSAVARLNRGATVETALNEARVIFNRFESENKTTNQGVGPVVKPFNDEANGGNIRTIFLALMGAVGFVLLISCANVANLLLSRSLSRRREVSVRAALGAGRWRIVRQLLVESVMLGITGGLAGLFLAYWGVKAFDLAVADVGKPYWIVFTMDYRVFGYFAGVCVLTGILFGLAPALQSSRLDLTATLKEGGRGSSGSRSRWLSGGLVVVELALALVLLAGAGIMIRSFAKMYGMQTGFDADRIASIRVGLPDKRYPKPEDRLAFYDRLVPRLVSIPGVEAAALTTNLPMGGSFGWRYEIEGEPKFEGERPNLNGLIVSPDYFKVLGIQILRGRGFNETDGNPGKTVAIVNQRAAARYWPGQDPLGKRLRILRQNTDSPWITVIGVVPDIRQNDPSRVDIDPLIYVPMRQDPPRSMALIGRASSNDGRTMLAPFRREVQAIDQYLPAFETFLLSDFFKNRRWAWQVFGSLFTIFAGIALLLASVGIYAVMAHGVTQRTQEIGVRVALGASSASVMRMVLRGGAIQLLLGLLLGLPGAYGATRVLKNFLVQTSPTDPITFAAIAIVLGLAGVLACVIPARRATRVDPVTALRYE